MNRYRARVVRMANTLLLSLSLGAGVTVMSAPRALAEDQDRCQRRIVHAEHELHEAIDHHGRHSKQAEHERRELHQARERCWNENHRWWDEHDHRWHQERDWDDRDHDRD